MSASSNGIVRTLPRERSRARLASRASDYFALTRPRVLALVLFTAPPALVLGDGAWPDVGCVLGVLLGAGLVGAGCSAFNAWLERDADARMERTRERPLPAGRLSPAQAVRFAVVVSSLGLAALFAVGGWPPVLVAAATLAHYVGVYTLWLKPRSAENIVIGGAAGAAAPLIADAAAHGQVGVWGLVLFAIVFLWTPPHFWAIALFRRAEYAAAGFPMLPLVAGEEVTRRRMLVYSLLLVPVTLLPWLGGALGTAYAAVAATAGAVFVSSIVRARRERTPEADRRVFVVSILQLTLVFTAMLGELALR
jgi:protoheme IX farnesyltransferase